MSSLPVAHYLYRITHIESGRFYVGVRSCAGDPEGDSYLGSGLWIKRAVRKYGREAFSREVLSTHSTREEALEAEHRLVDEEMLADELCMNMRRGGKGGSMPGEENPFYGKKHGERFREFHRERMSGEKNPNWRGKAATPEAREKMSRSRSGENNVWYGKKLSEEHRKKMSEAQKRRWERYREEKRNASRTTHP